MKLSLAFMPFLMAGALVAQQPPAPATGQPGYQKPTSTQNQAQTGRRGNRSEYFIQHLSNQLGLTPDQQTQVRSIFADTRKSAEALAPKMREEREALKMAVKSGNDREIDRVLQQNSQLNADFEAMHVKAMAKVYRLLTPDQKTKFDQLDSGWFAPTHHMHGARNNASRS
ncbi:MAG TPA: Spy/CpxP family protein refolding chaperone [Bryobacteraceae bacterium]|jgi:Spy/CpxP family protein refolding chaperone